MRRALGSLLTLHLLCASAAQADPDVTILTLNLWHWVQPARDAVGTLLDGIDDLPAPGAGGPAFLALQEVSLPLVESELLARDYFLVAESAAASGIGKVVASKTPLYHASATDRFGGPCSGVCDLVETCTIVGADPVCVLDVHSQAWQVGAVDDAYREDLSRTIVARARELARGGFLVLVAGDFNAPVDAQSIAILEDAGLDDAWIAVGQPECTVLAPEGCTLVDNPIEDTVALIPSVIPDHRRIDHLYAIGGASQDGWQEAEIRFDGGANGPRVSGQNGVYGAHGGPGSFQAVTPEGEYDVDLTCSSGCAGLYRHRMSIASWDPSTGAFTGAGHYVDDPSIRWTVEGTTTGANFSLTYTYLPPNAGFVGTASGTLDGTGAPTAGSGGSATHGLAYGWSAARRSPAGRYAVAMTTCEEGACPGASHQHTLDVETWDPATGAFSGRGRYDADPGVTWAASGQVSGTRFDLSFAYDGVGAPYEASVVGSIDADGRLRFGLGADGASPATRFGLRAVFVPEPAPGAAAFAAALALCWLSRGGRLPARRALTR